MAERQTSCYSTNRAKRTLCISITVFILIQVQTTSTLPDATSASGENSVTQRVEAGEKAATGYIHYQQINHFKYFYEVLAKFCYFKSFSALAMFLKYSVDKLNIR